MKCALCNERNGNTRCEGCNTLFCLPCMNKHHDQLAQQFQQLMDVQNEVKQALDVFTSNNKQSSCLTEIDRWERETIQRIQKIAANARTKVNEVILKPIGEIVDRFEPMSAQMQQQQKDGDYLETDIERLKNQLDQLKNDIKVVNERIRIDSSLSNSIEWDTLLRIVEEEESPNRVTSEPMPTNDKVSKEKTTRIFDVKGKQQAKDNSNCDKCMKLCIPDDIFVFACEANHRVCYNCFAKLCSANMNKKKVLTCGSCAYQLQDSEIKQLRVPADLKRQYLEYQTKKTFGAFRFKWQY